MSLCPLRGEREEGEEEEGVEERREGRLAFSRFFLFNPSPKEEGRGGKPTHIVEKILPRCGEGVIPVVPRKVRRESEKERRTKRGRKGGHRILAEPCFPSRLFFFFAGLYFPRASSGAFLDPRECTFKKCQSACVPCRCVRVSE